ncbi:hypothetical protein [Candidatus Ruminimicrobium bovinum]|uniref:hypothetical protein n=1 Tax=Candidatus Ruminimicrobium bovinum TaxID=3242779 RepID=UPI0039B91C88
MVGSLEYYIGSFVNSLICLVITHFVFITVVFSFSFIISWLIFYLMFSTKRKNKNKPDKSILENEFINEIKIDNKVIKIWQKILLFLYIVLTIVAIELSIYHHNVYPFRMPKMLILIFLVIMDGQLMFYFYKLLIKYKNRFINKYRNRNIIIRTVFFLWIPILLIVFKIFSNYSIYLGISNLFKKLFSYIFL